MKLHLSPEQIAQKKRTTHFFMFANAIFCIINLTIALTCGFVPSFFVGGINGAVILLLWEHA